MFRFLIFVDTINSIYEWSKNIRGDEAVGEHLIPRLPDSFRQTEIKLLTE